LLSSPAAILYLKGVKGMFLRDALRAAGAAVLDMAVSLFEGLRESPRIFFAPLVGMWAETRRALADLHAKHTRHVSGRV
jgi:hypothetical protein